MACRLHIFKGPGVDPPAQAMAVFRPKFDDTEDQGTKAHVQRLDEAIKY